MGNGVIFNLPGDCPYCISKRFASYSCLRRRDNNKWKWICNFNSTATQQHRKLSESAFSPACFSHSKSQRQYPFSHCQMENSEWNGNYASKNGTKLGLQKLNRRLSLNKKKKKKIITKYKQKTRHIRNNRESNEEIVLYLEFVLKYFVHHKFPPAVIIILLFILLECHRCPYVYTNIILKFDSFRFVCSGIGTGWAGYLGPCLSQNNRQQNKHKTILFGDFFEKIKNVASRNE